MNKQKFWSLIDQAITKHPKKTYAALLLRCDALTKTLKELPVDEVFLFQTIWRVYTTAIPKKVIDVADDMAGELTGDGLTDFKSWMIIQGQETFEKLIAKPEELRKHGGKTVEITFEEAGYVATRALDHHIANWTKQNEANPFKNGDYDLDKDRFVTYTEKLLEDYGTNYEWVEKLLTRLSERYRDKRLGKKVEDKGKLISQFLTEFETHVKAK